MQISINKGSNNTYKVNVTIEAKLVDEAYLDALKHEAKDAEIKGFRKGKAPLDIVKKNVDRTHLRSHALNHLLFNAYPSIIKENKLNPIVYPKFDIKEFEEGKNLVYTMTIIERPEIKLGDYKAKLEKITKAKGKKSKPITNQEIIDVVVETSEIAVAEELIKEETDRMIASLIDQTGRMGLTIDSYLRSQGKSPQQFRNEYTKIAEHNIKADFLITEIADKEGITVTDSEIEQTIAAIPDEASKKALQSPDQKMYIKAVLLKNKTIQKLALTSDIRKASDNAEKVDS